jgi:cation transport protein ChaC
MWKPGFIYAERVRARLDGFRRAFCIYSTHHRGDAKRPGMVMGLDRGHACVGMAYRVAPDRAPATLAYLRAREQVNGVYREARVPLTLLDSEYRHVTAIAYIVERAHPSYAGALPLTRQAALIRGAKGISGPNLDYLVNTVAHLRELAIREPDLERLLVLSGPLFSRGTCCPETAVRPGSRALLAACRTPARGVPLMRPADRRRFVYRMQMAKWAARPEG